MIAIAAAEGRWSGRTRAGDPSTVLLESGWSTPEDWGVWTDGVSARLRLPICDGARWRVALTGYGFVGGYLHERSIAVRAGEQVLAKWIYAEDLPCFVKEFEVEGDGCGEGLALAFDIPSAISPAEAGCSADTRRLGLGLQSIEIERVT